MTHRLASHTPTADPLDLEIPPLNSSTKESHRMKTLNDLFSICTPHSCAEVTLHFLITCYYKFSSSHLIKSLPSFPTLHVLREAPLCCTRMLQTSFLTQGRRRSVPATQLALHKAPSPERTPRNRLQPPAPDVQPTARFLLPHTVPTRNLFSRRRPPPAPRDSGRESGGPARPRNPEPREPLRPAPAPPKGDVAAARRETPLPARRAAPLLAPPPVPVTPDAVQQLHEGEGEVEAEEEEEVAGGLVRQDRPSRERTRVTAGSPRGDGRRRSRSPGGPGIAPSALRGGFGRGPGPRGAPPGAFT